MKIGLLLILLLLTGCSLLETPIIPEISSDILTTEDNITIKYNYNKIDSEKAVILLHMLDRNRHDWNTFAIKLNQNNFSTLAIDFRGHGDSTGNWEEFSDEDFSKMVLDVKAAKEFLDKQNYSEVYLVGASIGANVAMKYAAENQSINKIVLLSPSTNYKNITTLDIINNYKGKLLISTGSKDMKSYLGSQQINETFEGEKEFLIYNTDLHGSWLLLNYNELNNKIIEFLKKEKKKKL